MVVEPCLREFEWALLQELGYGLDFTQDASCYTVGNHLHQKKLKPSIDPMLRYSFFPKQGFVSEPEGVISGADLLAIAAHNYTEMSTLQVAKFIAREALRPLLGEPLNSRVMYQQLLAGC